MSQQRTDQIAEALAIVRARIRDACDAAGRQDEVSLVVVTKTFPASDVDVLAMLGVVDVGENRDREARLKRDDSTSQVRWHMLGQLQRNKAASVAAWADVVESVDRPELVTSLAKAASAAGRRLEVLVQVSLDSPPQSGRGGVDPSHVLDLAAAVVVEPALDLRGVMGVAPNAGDPGVAFSLLAGVAGSVRERWPAAARISAGMSGDLEQAIAHGATQVRIGGAILGRRAAVQ